MSVDDSTAVNVAVMDLNSGNGLALDSEFEIVPADVADGEAAVTSVFDSEILNLTDGDSDDSNASGTCVRSDALLDFGVRDCVGIISDMNFEPVVTSFPVIDGLNVSAKESEIGIMPSA